MAVTDLIPWGRGRNVPAQRGGDVNPFLSLHREMNRLFDDVFRGLISRHSRIASLSDRSAGPTLR
jgi:hypothetical protein